MKKLWSEEEIKFLVDNINIMTLKEISTVINRPLSGVYSKLSKLSLH